MLLELTIFQLDTGPLPPDQAAEKGQLGFMQWLGALPGGANYRREAMRAFARAEPFQKTSPAVRVFCDLLLASVKMPPQPLPLALPAPSRRGGAQARRHSM